MRQVEPFTDERLADYCAFCGNPSATGDHVPPKIFLDKPYPENYPKIWSCLRCNNGASLDEKYVACILAVAASGSADPAEVGRLKITRSLEHNPDLARRLEAGFQAEGSFALSPDDDARTRRVFEKMARGLWTYENGEIVGTEAAVPWWAPIATMTSAQLAEFHKLSESEVLPEVGSRKLVKLLEDGDEK